MHYLLKIGDYGEADLLNRVPVKDQRLNWCIDIIQIGNMLLNFDDHCTDCEKYKKIIIDTINCLKDCKMDNADSCGLKIDVLHNFIYSPLFENKYQTIPEDYKELKSDEIITPLQYYDYDIVDTTWLQKISPFKTEYTGKFGKMDPFVKFIKTLRGTKRKKVLMLMLMSNKISKIP